MFMLVLVSIRLSYPQGAKGYRLWVKEWHGFRVIISRDVIFNESKMPWKQKEQRKLEGEN